MERHYRSRMDIVLPTRKGFTLPELLLTIIIFAAAVLLTSAGSAHPDLQHLYFMDDYLLRQSEAMSQRISCFYEKGITFNSMGHVNMGKTLHFGSHEIIVHLGNGYATLQ